MHTTKLYSTELKETNISWPKNRIP
jgi:hypothetical protein